MEDFQTHLHPDLGWLHPMKLKAAELCRRVVGWLGTWDVIGLIGDLKVTPIDTV